MYVERWVKRDRNEADEVEGLGTNHGTPSCSRLERAVEILLIGDVGSREWSERAYRSRRARGVVIWELGGTWSGVISRTG